MYSYSIENKQVKSGISNDYVQWRNFSWALFSLIRMQH